MPTHAELTSFWWRALPEPLGIWIATPDPVRLKSLLYAARAKETSGDPHHPIAKLQLRTAAPGDGPGLGPNVLWVVNPPPDPEE